MSREPTNVNYLLFTQQTFVNKSNDPMVGKNPIRAIPLIQWKIVDRIKLKEEIKNRSKKKKKKRKVERQRSSARVCFESGICSWGWGEAMIKGKESKTALQVHQKGK